MTIGTIAQDVIQASLQVHWADQVGGEYPTVYGGQQLDLTGETGWYELWVQSWLGGAQRTQGHEHREVLVSVHVFARSRLDLGLIHAMTDRARRALIHQLVVLRDYDLSEAPEVGVLRLREVDVRNLTRVDREQGGIGLEHHLVTCRGMAEESGTS